MARPKRNKPYNPALAEYQRMQAEEEDAKKRDRRATDLLRNARVAPMEVRDPISGETIIVFRSTADPLAALHARHQIDDAQYHGGRAFQADFEIIEEGAQAVDPSKPYVDCSPGPQGASDAHNKALDRLNAVNKILGLNGSALAYAVLIDGRTIDLVCADRKLTTQRENDYIGKRFRECLDDLARFYGFAMNGDWLVAY